MAQSSFPYSGFTPQSFLRSLLSTEDHHSHDNGRSTVVTTLTRTTPVPRYVESPLPFTLPTLGLHPCTLTDIVISVHPIGASSVAPPTLGDACHSHANANPFYAHTLPPHWVIPVVTQSIICYPFVLCPPRTTRRRLQTTTVLAPRMAPRKRKI
jgi:hypothetical protein